MWMFLIVLCVAASFGLQGWRTLFNNFAVEVGGVDGLEMGAIQSVREVPGFLALLVVYILLVVREHRLIALSVIVMGAGVSMVGFFPSFVGLAATTLVMSFGFHYYETVNQSLTLQYFDRMQAPLVLGRLRAWGAVTNIAVGGLIFVASSFFNYTQMYAGIGLLVACAGIWALTRDPSDKNIVAQHKKMVFRRRYWLYYVLTFLAGARRQVFVAFALFLLVKKFNFTIHEITALFIFNNIINTMAAPMVGRAVNRFGERRVLSVEYLTLIAVFLVYAYTESKIVVAAVYVVDHIVFQFVMAIRTYFQKIADPKDIASGMAVGFTINHIAAVAVPLAGGALWMFSYQAVFIGGALLSLVSLIMVQFLRVPD